MYPKAECVHGKCVCKGDLIGPGDFDCRKPTLYNGNSHTDPIIHSMNGENVDLPITCRYLFTHFTSTYSKLPDSFCTLQVHIFQSKLHGKVYVEGMDIALKVNSPTFPPGFGSYSVRTYGNASAGLYTFDEHGQLEYSPDGPWRREDGHLRTYLPGAYVALTHDPYNNMAKFDVPDCGFKVTFRPADYALGMHQRLIPGVSVDVDPEHSPVFKENHRCLNIPPNQHHHLDDMSRNLGVTRQQAQIYKTFMSGVAQNQPDAAPNCARVPESLDECPKSRLPDAMDKCHFLITDAPVMNCLDHSNNGNTILGHYNKCLKAFCSKSKHQCEAVQHDLHKCKGYNAVKTFRNSATCKF